MMLILPSVFTERRIKEIEKTTSAINHVCEALEVCKTKRKCLEKMLPHLDSCWGSVYREVEALWLEQLRLENEREILWFGVTSTIGEIEKPRMVGFRVLD